MDLGKVKELALDISVSLEMTDVDTGAYIDAAKEKAALLIAELEKPADDDAGRALAELVFSVSYCIENHEFDTSISKQIYQYAESYHAKKCAECVGNLPAFPHRPEAPNA